MLHFKTCPIEEHFEVLEEIGSGQFAKVRRCLEKTTGTEFAAKFMRKKRVAGSRRGVTLEHIQREVNILKELNHENIVKLFDVFDVGNEVVLILELVKGGELFDYLCTKERLCEAEAIDLLRPILLGLNHMHHKNVVHLDLKPENVMLLKGTTSRVKLIDFGLSRRVSSGSDVREMNGTPEFVAPEIINYETISLATDMWSLGVITYILLSGASPFLGDTKQETFANITASSYHFDGEYFDPVTDLAKDFISRLLQKDPRKRPTAQQCLDHPWIKSAPSPAPMEPKPSRPRNGMIVFDSVEDEQKLWDAEESRYSSYVYGGLRLQCESEIPSGHLMTRLFSRLQVSLRQSFQDQPDLDEEELYQWYDGSKCFVGQLEAIIRPIFVTSCLHYEAIELKVRCPPDLRLDAFYLMEDILYIIETTFGNICPGLSLERHYYSPSQLKGHQDKLSTFSPSSLMIVMTSTEGSPLLSKAKTVDGITEESLSDIICFGSTNINSAPRPASAPHLVSLTVCESLGVSSSISSITGPTLASDLHVTNLPFLTKQKLCALLDPPEPMGRDWCILGVKLGLTEKLPNLETGNTTSNSPTWRLLEECCREINCTIGFLLQKLEELGRPDTIGVVLRTAPLLKVFPSSSSSLDQSGALVEECGASSDSYSCSSNMSRMQTLTLVYGAVNCGYNTTGWQPSLLGTSHCNSSHRYRHKKYDSRNAVKGST